VEAPTTNGDANLRSSSSFWTLTLGSVGVVYGDIGTSPLYAFREVLNAAIGAEGKLVSVEVVLGVLSLILWALTIIVTAAKYVLILLRADNKGEGGILSLMALSQRALGSVVILTLGMIGAALFYGDSLITPAISVLSAVEGLEIVTPALEAAYVIPLSVLILVGLFAVQSHGTARVAAFFGPVMAIWFIAIAVAGVSHIADEPSVLAVKVPITDLRSCWNGLHR
jgi:KUP system potassium uptake protein